MQKRKSLRPILSEEQQRLCNYSLDGKPRLVRGVAGSGKTVVLAHWLAKVLQQIRSFKILVVYANRSLLHLLREYLEKAWQKLDNSRFPWRQVELRHIKVLLQELFVQAHLSYQYGFEYDQASQIYLSKIPDYKIIPFYDALFIDEAQDFGPETLKLLFSLVKSRNSLHERQVMIFYDNAQNIYRRKLPRWSELGLDMRGRSTVMKESFRSTRPICELALNVLYRLQPPQADPEHRELTKRNLIECRQYHGQNWWRVHFNHINGPLPIYQQYRSRYAEIDALAEQLAQWIHQERVQPNDIRILANTEKVRTTLERRIAPILARIDVRIMIQRQDSYCKDEDTIIITTVNSFKGYDAEILVIPAIDCFIAEDRILANNLYVAMTRARSLLYVSGVFYKGLGSQILNVVNDCVSILEKHSASTMFFL